MLEILQLSALSDNYIYLVHDPMTGETAVIDPAESLPVLDALNRKGWRLSYIFNTHHHPDHIGGNSELKLKTNCKVVAAKADILRIPGIDIMVGDGDEIRLGAQSFEIIATPGHTLGHIVYYCRDSQALFCGDTLFSMGCGRLFEGSAEQMWQSLKTLKELPAATRVYCAHEYTQANGRFAWSLEPDNTELAARIDEVKRLREQGFPTIPSTIGLERSTNPFLREDSPTIRRAVAATDSEYPPRIFAKIRQLKDQFR